MEGWTIVEKGGAFGFRKVLRELIGYKDLVFLLFRRDIKSSYQQTILGPLWLLIQPIFTSIVFTVLFGGIARIPTPPSISPFAFYLLGLSFWNYFADCFNRISVTFVTNAAVFSKVYFPRLAVPVSVLLSGGFRFIVQFGLFLVVYAYGVLVQGYPVRVNIIVLFLPFLLAALAIFAMGLGLIVTSMTTKYRDLSMLVSFGVQLLMYASPVAYPLFAVPHDSVFYKILLANPLTGILETSKYAFTSEGLESTRLVLADCAVITTVAVTGIFTFSKVEKRFMDTV